MGFHFILQGIFQIKGSNQRLLHWQVERVFTTVPPGKPIWSPVKPESFKTHAHSTQQQQQNNLGVLTETALNLYINLERIDILTILNLSMMNMEYLSLNILLIQVPQREDTEGAEEKTT